MTAPEGAAVVVEQRDCNFMAAADLSGGDSGGVAGAKAEKSLASRLHCKISRDERSAHHTHTEVVTNERQRGK